jgi:hypothetical protein
MSRMVILLGALGATRAAPPDCVACHRDIAHSFARTAHANASRLATAESILGPFDAPANRLNTSKKGTYFLMERGEDGRFYQSGVGRYPQTYGGDSIW